MSTQPNILILFPDQLRADFLGCYGAEFAKTPNIDRLCSESIQYIHAVSPSPVSVPARASMLTGFNAIKTGVFHNDHWLRPDHAACGMPTWAELLRENGYCTASIGKMHFYPWDIAEGFDFRLIAEDKRHYDILDDYADYLNIHGFRKYHANKNPGYQEHKGAACSRIPMEHQVDIWTANQTVKFITQHNTKKPFACMVGFPGPHCPYDPPDKIAALFDPRQMPESIPPNDVSRHFHNDFVKGSLLYWNGVDYTTFTEEQKKRVKAYYSALIHQIDIGVGWITDCLQKTGQLNNTIIIFASDHGEYAGDFDMVGKGHFSGPSIHIPLLIRVPGQLPQTINTPVSLTDLFSSILQLAGVDCEENNDSRILPGLPNAGQPRDHLFAASALGYMVLTSQWKYSRYLSGLKVLYNLNDDPQEQRNRINDPACAPIIQKLDAILTREIDESIEFANREKCVERGGLCGEGPFGKRGWQRTYPANSNKFIPHHLLGIDRDV
ncbi:MAG: sulfatase-like hydrolase/transferase [Kiritimatiellales bacterium]